MDGMYIYLMLGYITFAVIAFFCMLKEYINDTKGDCGGVNFVVEDLLLCIIFSIIPVVNIFVVCMYVCIYIAYSPKMIKVFGAYTKLSQAIRNKVNIIMRYPIIKGEKNDEIQIS